MSDDHPTTAFEPLRTDEAVATADRPVLVSHLAAGGERRTHRFRSSFLIGSHPEADVRIEHPAVSRRHAEIFQRDGQWWLRDLDSTNGTRLNGALVQEAPLSQSSVVRVVPGGAPLHLEIEGSSPALQVEASGVDDDTSVTGIYRRYFTSTFDGTATGERGLKIRQAFDRARHRQAKPYRMAIALLLLILVAIGSITYLQHRRLQQVNELAVEIFYQMRQMELDLARLDAPGPEPPSGSSAGGLRRELRALEERYDELLEEIGILGSGVSEEDRLILRMARVFGECELTMPDSFADEVKRYIDDWRNSQRLQRAMVRLERHHQLAPTTFAVMVEHHLPPQFLYLALQESDFDLQAVGPRTRFGIAKGPWQFMPDTALHFGLSLGPLVELRRYDPADERFDIGKATEAAARYLRYLYTTDAQASGLLVLAAYNWGETALRRRLRSLPPNPRQRNFWRLLQAEAEEVPEETYDYVFRVFSAAVIAESPRLFGFEFANPLAGLEEEVISPTGGLLATGP